MNQKSDDSIDAKTKSPLRWNWAAWLFPVLAIVVAGWVVYRSIPNISASIQLSVDRADDIEANNTLVFHRGVRIGRVADVALSEGLDAVELTVDLDDNNSAFARAGARYWLVRPGNASLESLSTIVSGPEIHAEPGDGEPQTRFEVSDPPLNGVGPGDLELMLVTRNRQSIGRGTRLIYRGVEAGVVTGAQLAPDASRVLIDINVFEDYAHLVRKDSVFWNSGGFNIDFGVFSGAVVSSNSINSLLSGEISFATPDPPGELVVDGDVFMLENEAEDDWLEWQPVFRETVEAGSDTESDTEVAEPASEVESTLQSLEQAADDN